MVAKGLGLGTANFTGSVINVPMITDAKRSKPSLFRPAMYNRPDAMRIGSVDPNPVTTLKNQLK
jgi:hypothetical protein